MAQVINTNIMSLNAQRNLNMTQTAMATAMQRLSSGLRINSAKDDAAGLAISERFTTQIRGLNQAVRNANDGISLAQTAEGAMAEMTSNLQRIRELAVQSANATNSASDRAALDKEVQQRLQEVQRIAEQTNFNGQKILDGTFGQVFFQVGPNVGDTIGINLTQSMKTVDIGAYVSQPSDLSGNTVGGLNAGVANTTGGTGLDGGGYQTGADTYTGVNANPIDGSNPVQINGTNILSSSTYAKDTYRSAESAYAKAAAVNASGVPGVTATAKTEVTLDDDVVSDGNFAELSGTLNAADSVTYTLKINNISVLSAGLTNADPITIDEAILAINSRSADTGILASKDADNKLILTAEDGRNIVIDETIAFSDNGATAATSDNVTIDSVFSTATTVDADVTDTDGSIIQQLTYRGKVTLESSDDVLFNQGQSVLGFSTSAYAAQSQLEGQNVLTVDDSNSLIRSVDSALTTVSNLRSTFGAIQNRFESTIANLSTTAENLTASRSRIMDADFAAETAALSRAQILQQAGTAMVAQANQVPQGVLQLLQG